MFLNQWQKCGGISALYWHQETATRVALDATKHPLLRTPHATIKLPFGEQAFIDFHDFLRPANRTDLSYHVINANLSAKVRPIAASGFGESHGGSNLFERLAVNIK